MPIRSRLEKDRRRKIIEAMCVILDYMDEDSEELISYFIKRRKTRPRGPKPAWPAKEPKAKVTHGKPPTRPGIVQAPAALAIRRLERGVSGVDLAEPRSEKKRAAKR